MLSTLLILVILSKEDSCEFITIISQRFGVSVDNPKPWDKFPQAPYMNCGFKAYHNSTLIVEVAMTNYFPLSFKLFPQIIETIPKRWFLPSTHPALFESENPMTFNWLDLFYVSMFSLVPCKYQRTFLCSLPVVHSGITLSVQLSNIKTDIKLNMFPIYSKSQPLMYQELFLFLYAPIHF